VSGCYVVDENGERVVVLLDVEKYEQLVAQHHAPAEHDESISDEPLDDEEDFDPEEGKRRITEFVTSADELPGPPVADLADHVAELTRAARRDVETIMTGNPHNKVLATQLLLSQRARGLRADGSEQWRLFATTTLLSGMVSTSASGAAE
jgi:hypothetical protein